MSITSSDYNSSSNALSKRSDIFHSVQATGDFKYENDGYSFAITGNKRRHVGLFKLIENFSFSSYEQNHSIYYEQVPSARAVSVYLQRGETSGNNSRTFGNDEVNYVSETTERFCRVYYPFFTNGEITGCIRNAQDARIAKIIGYKKGDIINANYNFQNERWEILGTIPDILRCRLTSELLPGNGVCKTATAQIVVYDETAESYFITPVEITVIDFLGRFSGTTGQYCYCHRFTDDPDETRWEILQM